MTAGGDRSRWRALGVTIAVPLALGALAAVPLPFVGAVRAGTGVTVPGLPGLLEWIRPSMGLLALGLAPVIAAFIVVELAAAIVPGWRSLRIGGPAARRRLLGETRRLALLFAMAEGTATAMETWGFNHEVIPVSFVIYLACTVAILVLGTALILVAAWLVETYGLIGGFSTLLGAVALVNLLADNELGSGLVRAQGYPPVAILLLIILPEVAIVAIVVWALRRNRVGDGTGERVPMPTSGLAPPLVVAAPLWVVPAAVAPLLARVGIPSSHLFPETLRNLLFVCAVFGLSWLFNQPRRVAALRRGLLPPEAGPDVLTAQGVRFRVRSGSVGTLALILALLAASWITSSDYFLAGLLHSPVPLAVLTAVFLDALEAWEARARGPRVAVWPLHRCYAVHPVLECLAGAGIHAEVRGRHHRTLLQFFGPHLPMEITVAPDDVEAATALLESRLGVPGAGH